jgi:S-adenosylmethionine:tRNA ribosyltransferase-isomerase
MLSIPPVDVKDFSYDLPPERIAQYPLAGRDSSKVLILKGHSISETTFARIHEHIPAKSLLVFNDTRVIRARLIFTKSTGATIEIFCLEPIGPFAEISSAFSITAGCTWKCLIGNVKRWKEGALQKIIRQVDSEMILNAVKKEDLGDGCFSVEFHWKPEGKTFSEVIRQAGLVPLPPYINRTSSESDALRYQTIYAEKEGSVAAPTAGLHFTDHVIRDLEEKGCEFARVTLHVGIGTFRPVNTPDITAHIMHGERIFVKRETISTLLDNKMPVVAVGTTTVRTLESLYWLGARILTYGTKEHPDVQQWDPYNDELNRDIPVSESLNALLGYLDKAHLPYYSGNTELMILPGYSFRFITGMITNFHMPQSTLLMLVAAFTGTDWKNAYSYAMEHDFRFLSYGDACLFIKSAGN